MMSYALRLNAYWLENKRKPIEHENMRTIQETYMLIYRVGTPVRYKWCATFITGQPVELSQHKKDIERMGYHVLMPKMERGQSGWPRPVHGMPESFSPDHQACNVMHEAWQGGWMADKDAYLAWKGGQA